MTDGATKPEDMRTQLKIGLPAAETIEKLRANNYQYASAGDTRRLIEALPRWRPIETAPKDGTTVLIVNSDAPMPDVCCAHWRNDQWICLTHEDWEGANETMRGNCWTLPEATHWMPLPEPPK